ncbi:MAG: heterodisulfide reductase-related iron-sulfur binding cluster [Acidimicrobiia bacterium]|nr:heterodisulfide reductase-related iron-sulfur binding cluster [Acidimicrobiia bacterium]
MTTTYDPFHPNYFDEADLRSELERVYDLCHGCRLCFKFCPSFPTLFEYVDAIPDQDVAQLTPAQQDHVVDECFNCKLCYVNCPYTPDQHEWQLDFPRLMLRAQQVLRRNRRRSMRDRLTDRALASTDMVGRVNTTAAPAVNRALGRPGSGLRTLMEKTVGIARERVVAPYAKQRFSTWFKARTPHLGRAKQATVAVFPTCLVEYQDVGVGHDLVKVYERNGIECRLPEGQICCGAPALHQGDVDRFGEQARQNIKVLSAAIRDADAAGEHLEVVVPQPTCGYVLKNDYTDYVGGPDAELVAERTKDAAEFLVGVHKADGTELDTAFEGEVPATTTYHAPCHLRAQNVGLKSRDLMKLTGSKIKVVAECSGIDGTWGLRAENVEASRGVAKKMADAIDKADGELVTGDCSLANGGIVLETGRVPVHPLQMVARAYGIDPEPDTPRLEAPNG